MCTYTVHCTVYIVHCTVHMYCNDVNCTMYIFSVEQIKCVLVYILSTFTPWSFKINFIQRSCLFILQKYRNNLHSWDNWETVLLAKSLFVSGHTRRIDRREGKGRRCCLGDADISTRMILKKRMNRIKANWRNGCFEKMYDHTVHTMQNNHPSKMDVLLKTFVQNILATKWLVRQVRSPNNSNNLCLLFCLYCILLLWFRTISWLWEHTTVSDLERRACQSSLLLWRKVSSRQAVPVRPASRLCYSGGR